jgi:hypothetical protein
VEYVSSARSEEIERKNELKSLDLGELPEKQHVFGKFAVGRRPGSKLLKTRLNEAALRRTHSRAAEPALVAGE